MTIGNVAGAGPPSYDAPVASTNARTLSSVTAYGVVGGKLRPTSDWSTAMVLNIDVDPPVQNGRVDEERLGSAGLAVQRVPALAGAVLLHLEPVGVVAPVLLGDVVALLALGARERDLGANVRGLAGHGMSFGLCCSRDRAVAGAGFEPATPRL